MKNCNSCDNVEFDYCHSSARIAAGSKWHEKIGYDDSDGLNCTFWMERSKNKQPRLNINELYDKCTKCKKTFRIEKLKVFAKGSELLCEDCRKNR